MERPSGKQQIYEKTYIDKWSENREILEIQRINLASLAKVAKDGVFKVKFEDQVYEVRAKYVDAKDEMNYTWHGDMYGKGEDIIGAVDIICESGNMYGEFNLDFGTYVIVNLNDPQSNNKNEDKIHFLLKKDSSLEGECGATSKKEDDQPRVKEEKVTSRSAPCTTLVDILVLYTPAAANNANCVSLAQLWIAEANNILRNSAIGVNEVNFRLVGVSQTSLIDDQISTSNDRRATAQRLLDSIQSNNGVEALRLASKADIVVFLTCNPVLEMASKTFGKADINNVNDRSRAHAFIQVTSPGSRYTFTHEIAHLFGCKHDQAQDESLDNLEYSACALEITSIDKKTAVGQGGSDNSRIPYFSNPNVNYNGNATGVSGFANNANMILQSVSRISQYEQGSYLNVNITGPNIIYHSVPSSYTWCVSFICDAETMTNISWHYSGDGFTWQYLANGNLCGTRSNTGFYTGANTIFIRFSAYTANGTYLQAIKPISVIRNYFYKSGSFEADALQAEMSLEVFPNPSLNGKMTIKYDVKKQGNYSLELANSNGITINRIFDNNKLIDGNYSLDIPTQDKISGIYYLILKSNSELKKIALMIKN
jgi:hypothetical protein